MVDIEAGVFSGEEVGEFMRTDEFVVAEGVASPGDGTELLRPAPVLKFEVADLYPKRTRDPRLPAARLIRLLTNTRTSILE
jgi:hypothetical protein